MERSLYKKRPEVYHELDVALKKFKPDFISLLKNPVSQKAYKYFGLNSQVLNEFPTSLYISTDSFDRNRKSQLMESIKTSD